jgi:glycosyltransferase involved in cell wall biosynthesis
MKIPVTIAAKNEEASLGACLDALLAAVEHGRGRGFEFAVLVVLDDCTDRTEEVARARGVQVLHSSGGKVEAQRAGLAPLDEVRPPASAAPAASRSRCSWTRTCW